MRLLGIDTASSEASVAIVESGYLICEKRHGAVRGASPSTNHSQNNHAENLLPLIDSALQAAALSLSEFAAFAVSLGPGSFTGLRIGVSTVKGLAYGCDVPVAGVSTLHACAARIENFQGLICALLDARKKQVYAATFRRLNGSLERLSDDAVLTCEDLACRLRASYPAEPVLLTGDGTYPYGEILLHALGDRARVDENQTLPTVAAAVAFIGASHIAGRETVSAAALKPLYLRPPEAQVIAEKNALTR